MGPHDIGWAIDCIRNGNRVRRPHWGAGFYVFAQYTGVTTFEGPQPQHTTVLFIHMPSLNRLQPFTCHHDDLLATDWQLA